MRPKTEQNIAKYSALFKEGHAPVEIASIHGVSRQYVKKILEKAGISSADIQAQRQINNHAMAKKISERNREIIAIVTSPDFANTSGEWEALSQRFNLTQTTIKHMLYMNGSKPPRKKPKKSPDAVLGVQFPGTLWMPIKRIESNNRYRPRLLCRCLAGCGRKIAVDYWNMAQGKSECCMSCKAKMVAQKRKELAENGENSIKQGEQHAS